MKQLVTTILISSFMVLCVTRQIEGASAGAATKQVQSQQQNAVAASNGREDTPNTKPADSKMPNIFLGFLNWPALSMMAPASKPIKDMLGGPTQQISDMVERIPMAQQIFGQMDSLASSMSGMFNPGQIMGQVGSLTGNAVPGMGRRR